MRSLFKKKDPAIMLKDLIKQLNRAAYKIDFKYQDAEDKVKEYFVNNKQPPAALLQGWKIYKNLKNFVENQAVVYQNQLMLVDLGNSLKNALGVNQIKDVKKALEKMNVDLVGMESLLDEITDMQMDSMQSMMEFNGEVEMNMNWMTGLTNKINDEATQLLGNEFIVELEKEDPEFFKTIPPNLKNP